MSGAEAVETITFGCRLNIVESEEMRVQALAAGHGPVTIVNTCAVTAEAVRQSRQAVRRAAADPSRRLIVTGCAAEIDSAAFAALPGVAALLPNSTKTAPATWNGTGHAVLPRSASGSGSSTAAPRHTRGFVEIQNGCDHRCTFCVIPYGRGASRSVAPDRVLQRVHALVEDGTQEIVLTGVDITAYGLDHADGTTLGALVGRILREAPQLPRLRLSSLDCMEVDAALLDAIASEPRLMPHLHLSLQSGSDLILKRMKRRHGRRDAIALCTQLRTLRPDLAFGADLIAGFPTEDEGMFRETLDLVEVCGVTYLHAFPYSPRPHTPAARMPPVPPPVVRERGQRLRELGQRRLAAHLSRQVGRTLQVLTERGGRGHAPDFSLVGLPDSTPPGLLKAAIVSGHDGRMLLGAPA